LKATTTEIGKLARLVILAAIIGLFNLAATAAVAQPLPPLPIDDDVEESTGSPATIAPAPPDDTEPAAAPNAIVSQVPNSVPQPLPPQPPQCETHFTGETVQRIDRRVQRVLRSKHLVGAKVGIVAVAYPEGVLLFEKNGNELFNPASVAKLFTAAGALLTLGPEARFETNLFAESGECPNIYLKGSGDPGLTEDNLLQLAKAVRQSGLACVRQLILDASLFDKQTLPPHYDQKESDASWRPRIGSVGVRDGGFAVRVSPGNYVGAAPKVKLELVSDCFVIDNRGVTVDLPGDEGITVKVSTLNGKVVVQVKGKLASTEEKGVLFLKAQPDPDQFAACCLVEKLDQAGVAVKQPDIARGKVPTQAGKIASITSGPLSKDLRRMQRSSLNFVAEQTLKLMAPDSCRPATFDCGLRRLRSALRNLGLHPSCMELGNGSGLFDANKVTPAQVVRLLVEMTNRSDLGDVYRKLLPVSGVSGTLAHRLKRLKKRVMAKTGTLDTVSALAGYAVRDDGGLVVFAILFNNATASKYSLRGVQDRIVEVLLGWAGKKRRSR
jgi:serine-type D-Ala-D-Ala carboxypeptidase/endopeptidase (penicillin-binding protein 4)